MNVEICTEFECDEEKRLKLIREWHRKLVLDEDAKRIQMIRDLDAKIFGVVNK